MSQAANNAPHPPAQKNILFSAVCLVSAAVLLFFLWLYASLHFPARIDTPVQDAAAQSAIQWELFDIALGERLSIAGRAAYGEDAVHRFETRVALVYDDKQTYLLPTRMVGSERYFDGSCFLSLAPQSRLPQGTAQIVILFASDDHDTAVYTGQFVTLGGGAV